MGIPQFEVLKLHASYQENLRAACVSELSFISHLLCGWLYVKSPLPSQFSESQWLGLHVGTLGMCLRVRAVLVSGLFDSSFLLSPRQLIWQPSFHGHSFQLLLKVQLALLWWKADVYKNCCFTVLGSILILSPLCFLWIPALQSPDLLLYEPKIKASW